MAFTQDTSTALISEFRGSVSSVDPYDVDPSHGLWAQNQDFVLGESESVQITGRRGTSQVAAFATGIGPITSLVGWYFILGLEDSLAVCYAPSTGVVYWDQRLNGFISPSGLNVTGAAAASFVTDGFRLYVAFMDSSGRSGTTQGRVYGFQANAVDTLFAPPLTQSNVAVTVSQPLAGTITAGTHRLALVFTTRNGYQGTLFPVTPAGVFAPVSFTAPDGTHNVRVTLNWLTAVPSYLSFPATIQVAMTSAANQNRYFLVAGATLNPSFGIQTIDFSINDADLVTGTEVTSSQNLLTQSVGGGGGGPFNPSALFTYSSRLGYISRDASGFPVIYFSDKNAYQVITQAFHSVYLEGRDVPVGAASLGALAYIASISSLWSVQDNGGQPTTWTPPARVDGSVGILSPTCICSSGGKVGGKIALASEKGLFIYRGAAFPQIPLSYNQSSDWNRINWNAPTQVQIVDDAFDRVIRVIAPLKVVVTGATNTNPIQITTGVTIGNRPIAYPHLFQTGLSVTLAGIGGNTNANGTFAITVTGPNTFTIPVAGNGTYTSGGVATPNTPNAEMTWNYTAGDSPDLALYSLNAFSAYRQGAIGIVRNLATAQDEVWYAPSVTNPAGNLIRRTLPTDTLIHRDVDLTGAAAAISTLYETSHLPGSQDEAITVHDFHGAHFRASGSGAMTVQCFGLDHVRAVTPAASPFTLSQTPGQEYLLKWFLRSEQQTIQVGTNAVDAYLVLALLRGYYTNSLPQR